MRLQVVRALKGIEAAAADHLWSSATSSCGVKLDQGGRHVIYTDLIDGRRAIHACGYGRALTSGGSDSERPPVAGRVTRYDVDRIREFESPVPIPSVRIALDRPAGRATATRDQGIEPGAQLLKESSRLKVIYASGTAPMSPARTSR